MEPEKKNSLTRRYAVFLSYRHADNKEPGRQWATWLHHLLEGYEIPEDLVGTKNSKGDVIPKSLYPVFRDEEELPADADLTRNIQQALENSDLLVVICSPRAVESQFVADEIRYFKELGKSNRILALMIDGEPNAADDPGKAKLGIKPQAECLPEPLRYGAAAADGKIDWSKRTEPIAADVRPEGNAEHGWTTGAAYREALQKEGKLREKEITQKVQEYEQRLDLATLKVVAGSLGVPLGVLTQRDKAMQLQKARQRARVMRRWLFAVGILAACAISAGILAILKAQSERHQRQLVQQAEIAAHESASTSDFSVADFKMKQRDAAGALPYLADALRQNPRNQAAIALTVAILRANPFLTTTLQHSASVSSATFSADSRYVLTSSVNVAQVWDTQTGERFGSPMQTESPIGVAEFASHAKGTIALEARNGLIWSAQLWDPRTGKTAGPPAGANDNTATESLTLDGKRALTVSKNGAQVWDLSTGKSIGTPFWNSPPGESYSRSFGRLSPDGKRAVIAWGSKVQVYEVESGQSIGKPIQLGDEVSRVDLSADGKRLLIVGGGDSEAVQLWEVDAARQIGKDIPYIDLIQYAVLSPSGKQFVTVYGGQNERGSVSEKVEAQVWDVETGNPVGNPVSHAGSINWVEFSPDERWLLTASDDRTARVWDARTGDPVGITMQHADKVNSAKFSPDGKWIVTASADNTARIWPAQTGWSYDEAIRYGTKLRFANFSRDAKWMVTGWSDNTARIWETQTGKLVVHSPAFAKPVDSASFSPDGTRVLSVSASNDQPTIFGQGAEARIWDAQTGRLIGEPMRHTNAITSADFSPDGTRVLTSSRDGTAQIWNAANGKPAGPPLKCSLSVYFAEFSPDGKRVLTGSGDGFIRIWDVQSPRHALKEINFVHFPDWPIAGTFSRDGQQILAVSDFQTARIWDATSGQPFAGPIRDGDLIKSAVFTPDGKGLMTTVGSDVQIWDVHTGKPLTEPMHHETLVKQATFTRDGRWIMTVPSEGIPRIWDAQTGKAVSQPLDSKGYGLFTWKLSRDAKWAYADSLADRSGWLWDGMTVAAEAPPWLADLAEAVSNQEVSPQGTLEPSQRDSNALRRTLQKLTGTDDLSRFGRWFVADPGVRTISPRSPVTVSEFVAQCLQENMAASVDEAHLLDPSNPLVVASLAIFEKDKDRALFLCRLALKRARIQGPPERIEQVRSIARSVFPDLPEFSKGNNIPSKSAH